MVTNPKQFEKWWKKVSMEGDWDYENYAQLGWEAALEWAEDRISESKSLGEALSKIIREIESKYDSNK